MPSLGVRLAGEAAFLVLVVLGLALAGFELTVIAVVMAMALVIVAFLERASAKEAARRAGRPREEPPSAPPADAERVDVEPQKPPVPAVQEQAAAPEPEPTVSERSARAILASAPPPLPKEVPKRRRPRRGGPSPPQKPEPEAPAPTVAPQEWNLWELQRAVRDAPDDARHQEWSALLIHLREFANADGDLPLEFDALVRESFAPLLARPAEPAGTL